MRSVVWVDGAVVVVGVLSVYSKATIIKMAIDVAIARMRSVSFIVCS